MLTPDALAAIRQRAEAASPAPWYPFVSPWPDKMHAVTVGDASGPLLAYVGHKDLPNDANLDFITYARTDVPALLDEVEGLQADLTTLRRDLVEADAQYTTLLNERDAALRERDQLRAALFRIRDMGWPVGHALTAALDMQLIARATLLGDAGGTEAPT